jgi:hypothetical protein
LSIFQNPRNTSTIVNLAKQFSAYDIRWVVDAYKDCTRAPYSYMLFDSTQSTPEALRVRSRILPGEFPPRVWVRRDQPVAEKKKSLKRVAS